MADNLVIAAGLAPVAARLPGSSLENLIIVNAGQYAVRLASTADNVLTATGNDMALATGITLPPGSEIRLYQNGSNVYARTTTLGSAVTALGVGATTVPVTNTTDGDVAVTLGGTGVVTAIAVGAVTVLSGTNLTGSVVVVPKGGTITLTYGSGTPTWTWKSGYVSSLQVSAGYGAT